MVLSYMQVMFRFEGFSRKQAPHNNHKQISSVSALPQLYKER